jgi:hypothetical protein
MVHFCDQGHRKNCQRGQKMGLPIIEARGLACFNCKVHCVVAGGARRGGGQQQGREAKALVG